MPADIIGIITAPIPWFLIGGNHESAHSQKREIEKILTSRADLNKATSAMAFYQSAG